MLPFDPKVRAAADKSYAQGLDAWARGERKEALRLFRRALRFNPRYAAAWNRLALAALQRGRVKEAEQRFLRAAEAARREFELRGTPPRASDPVGHAWLEARRNLALLAARRRLFAVAARELDQVLTDDPGDALGVRFIVGEQHHLAGDLDQAVAAYRRAPEEPGARFGLALALHAQGNHAAVGPALLRAFVANRYIAPLLLDEPWQHLDGYHSTNMAEPVWARAYVDRMGKCWRGTTGALATLRSAWTATAVQDWRASLDGLAVRLGHADAEQRSQLLDEWVGLITDDAVARVVASAGLSDQAA